LFNNILVVCMGNICRSPMGEYLLREKVNHLNQAVNLSSAGLGALVGNPADDKAIAVMAERGIDISSHRACQLLKSSAYEKDLILVMETYQQKDIEQLQPILRGRVHLMGKWGVGEIADPYGKKKQAFVEACEKINDSCEEWCSRLW
jgi:protein-tyrosine phosphatase